jgi:3-oxoacyl-[acyl-carrier protein] reductase
VKPRASSEVTPKLVIITGAANGIGRATALKLAAEGYRLAPVDVDRAGLRKLEKETGAVGFRCDLSSERQVLATVKSILSRQGTPFALVNNAGIGGPFHLLSEVSSKEWDWIFHTNVKAPFLLSRELLPLMARNRGGRIVNIASIQGLHGATRSSTYVATKHALVGYTRSIAAEWGPKGVSCNAVCPGYVETRMGIQKKKISAHRRRVIDRTPMRRVASPEEIAAIIAFLLSENTAYINGSVVVADGGITADIGI